jgi:hypothetical protein
LVRLEMAMTLPFTENWTTPVGGEFFAEDSTKALKVTG